MTLERALGCPLPPAVRESFLEADGQDLEGSGGGLFYGLYLLPLEEVRREWEFWRKAETDPQTGANPAVLATMASVPPQWVKSLYACRGWLPLLSDRSGNYVGVDLDPGAGGSWGQIIIFGRDFDRKCVVWRGEGEGGWAKWFASIVDDLESGEGWEADKSSDDEEEVGYSSYNGGQTYGNAGGTMRLVGQYKGWAVLEAWWDKSVRKWEGLGLGMDVAEVERGMDEARRLAGVDKDKGKGKSTESNATSPRQSDDYADESTPISPEHQSPTDMSHPDPDEDEVPLFPPASPDQTIIPRVSHPAATPSRITAAISAASSHPLKEGSGSQFLSPPARTSSGGAKQQKRRRPPPPAPSQLDLPTRADVQASQAVAQAEATGLRGGWVMNLDTSAGAAGRRLRTHTISPSLDAEMVDIDLESGRGDAFGTPPMIAEDIERQAEEDRLSLAGIEHRRDSRSPVLLAMSRTPSPLSRNHSYDNVPNPSSDRATTPTPKGSYTSPTGTPPRKPSLPMSTVIRPPPPVGEYGTPIRGHSPTPELDREREVIRGAADRRRSSTVTSMATSERENSLSALSTDSHEGLLTKGTKTTSPPRLTASPPAVNGTTKVDDLADGMEEVQLA